MIKQIKTGIRLLPYTCGIGMSAVFGILMFLAGCVLLFFGKHNSYMGMYCIIAVAMWPIQLLYSLGVSDMIQTSPWKKKTQTSVSALLGLLGFEFTNLLIFISQWAGIQRESATESQAAFIMLMGSVMSVLFMIYMGAALKYFVVSTITFIIAIIPLFLCIQVVSIDDYQLSFGICAAVSFIIVFLGALLQYGITCLVYKAPISKRAQLTSLKKMM